MQPMGERAYGSDSDSDSDGAPEAVSSSALKREMLSREKEGRLIKEQARAAKRSKNRERQSKLDDSRKLDPSLFIEAEAAFNMAKAKAEGQQHALLQQQPTPSKTRKSSRRASTSTGNGEKKNKQEYGSSDQLKSRTIGDTLTVQQLGDPSTSSANIDPSTAMPSSSASSFIHNRLFKKPRKAMQHTRAAIDAKKRKKEEKPFLLFDPLLDKPKEDAAAAANKPKSRAASRMQLEERMRGRRDAKTAYSKQAKRSSLGPSLGFAKTASAKSGRKHGGRSKL